MRLVLALTALIVSSPVGFADEQVLAVITVANDGRSTLAVRGAGTPALVATEPDVLSRRGVLAQSPSRTTDEELVAALRSINQRLGDLESRSQRLVDIESRQHGYEVRLSALERGAISVSSLRAPSVLTDPLAAHAAGRVVGGYDSFGRFVGFTSHSVVPGSAGFQTFASPVVRQPAQLSASAMTSFATASSGYGVASAGGCSGGSCGRPGLIGRIHARRGR